VGHFDNLQRRWRGAMEMPEATAPEGEIAMSDRKSISRVESLLSTDVAGVPVALALCAICAMLMGYILALMWAP
jgi:cell division protein FtsL